MTIDVFWQRIEEAIPDKDALIAMMATSYITPDNIQAVQGNVVEFIRQIGEAVQNDK